MMMQKILIGLLVLLLGGVYIFIQNSTTDSMTDSNTKGTLSPLTTKNKNDKAKQDTKPEATSKPKADIPQHTQITEPFDPKVHLGLDPTSQKLLTQAEAIEMEGKGERELRKMVFSDMKTRMTRAMEAIPACLENAESKEEALACNQKLDAVNKEFELLLGIGSSDVPQGNQGDFIWNETIKTEMIKQLDEGLAPMQEMFNCLEDADTEKDEEKCYAMEG